MQCSEGIQSVRLLDVSELEAVAGGRESTTTIGETFPGNGGAAHANISDPGQTRFGEATGGSMTATEGHLAE